MHSNLTNGTTIHTADGKELGTVKEIRGAYFKVDAPMAKDYWLACDAVRSEPGAQVTVAFTEDLLDANKQPEPAAV